MSFTTCQIHFTNRNGRTVYASNTLYNQLKLSSKKPVRLVLGRKKIQTPVKKIRKSGNHLYLPVGIRSLIRVPRGGASYVLSQGGDVKLGPLIGILSSSVTRNLNRPFGSRTEIIKTSLKAGNNKAVYVASNTQDIHWENEPVVAYFPNGTGGWSRKIVPLPDVVYNRLPSRSAEKSAAMHSLKERFIRRGIPIFNWSFFDKWDVYRLLVNDGEASPHVPESYIDPSPEQIKSLLEKHGFIYLKPTGGSLGIGIIRLTYHKTRGYFARF